MRRNAAATTPSSLIGELDRDSGARNKPPALAPAPWPPKSRGVKNPPTQQLAEETHKVVTSAQLRQVKGS